MSEASESPAGRTVPREPPDPAERLADGRSRSSPPPPLTRTAPVLPRTPPVPAAATDATTGCRAATDGAGEATDAAGMVAASPDFTARDASVGFGGGLGVRLGAADAAAADGAGADVGAGTPKSVEAMRPRRSPRDERAGSESRPSGLFGAAPVPSGSHGAVGGDETASAGDRGGVANSDLRAAARGGEAAAALLAARAGLAVTGAARDGAVGERSSSAFARLGGAPSDLVDASSRGCGAFATSARPLRAAGSGAARAGADAGAGGAGGRARFFAGAAPSGEGVLAAGDASMSS